MTNRGNDEEVVFLLLAIIENLRQNSLGYTKLIRNEEKNCLLALLTWGVSKLLSSL